jgi:hypothetical protein
MARHEASALELPVLKLFQAGLKKLAVWAIQTKKGNLMLKGEYLPTATGFKDTLAKINGTT